MWADQAAIGAMHVNDADGKTINLIRFKGLPESNGKH
jgi:hypothetical protein